MRDETYEAGYSILIWVIWIPLVLLSAIPFGWAWDGVRSAFTALPHLDYIQCIAVLWVTHAIFPNRVIAVRRDH